MAVSKDQWLKQLRSDIPEVSPEDVRSELDSKKDVLIGLPASPEGRYQVRIGANGPLFRAAVPF